MVSMNFYYKNTFHHLYNRGVERNKIFLDEGDYQYFLKKLRKYKEECSINMNCYCLLPNHFHLFVKQMTDDFPIGRFISNLTNSYTKGINKKYGRAGVLFEGRTSNRLITDDDYFWELCKYILTNPVKAGLVNKPEDWKYSSARKYFGIAEDFFTDEKEILNKFKSPNEFISFINEKGKAFDYSLLF